MGMEVFLDIPLQLIVAHKRHQVRSGFDVIDRNMVARTDLVKQFLCLNIGADILFKDIKRNMNFGIVDNIRILRGRDPFRTAHRLIHGIFGGLLNGKDSRISQRHFLESDRVIPPYSQEVILRRCILVEEVHYRQKLGVMLIQPGFIDLLRCRIHLIGRGRKK